MSFFFLTFKKHSPWTDSTLVIFAWRRLPDVRTRSQNSSDNLCSLHFIQSFSLQCQLLTFVPSCRSSTSQRLSPCPYTAITASYSFEKQTWSTRSTDLRFHKYSRIVVAWRCGGTCMTWTIRVREMRQVMWRGFRNLPYFGLLGHPVGVKGVLTNREATLFAYKTVLTRFSSPYIYLWGIASGQLVNSCRHIHSQNGTSFLSHWSSSGTSRTITLR